MSDAINLGAPPSESARWTATKTRARRFGRLFAQAMKSPTTVAGTIVIVVLISMAVFAPLLIEPNTPDPYQMPRDWLNINAPPGIPGTPPRHDAAGWRCPLRHRMGGAEVVAARIHRRDVHRDRRRRGGQSRRVPGRQVGRVPDAGHRRRARRSGADPRAGHRGGPGAVVQEHHHRDLDPRLAEVRAYHARAGHPHQAERVRRRGVRDGRFAMEDLLQGSPSERDHAGGRSGDAGDGPRRPVRRDAQLHRPRRGGPRRMGQPGE